MKNMKKIEIKSVINKLKKDFVDIRISKMLKHLGFNEYCYAYYNSFGDLKLQPFPYMFWSKNDNIKWFGNIFTKNKYKKNMCTAPSYEQVVDWFFLGYNIFIEIQLTDNTNEYGFSYCIIDSTKRIKSASNIESASFKYSNDRLYFNTKDAYEAAFYKVIGIITERRKETND